MLEPEVSTKAIRADDLATVSALGIASKASWGYSAEEMAVFEPELTLSEATLAELLAAEVALVAGEIVGYYTLREHGDGAVELEHLFVAEGMFHRGIGSALLRSALGRARAHGVTRLMIIADPNSAGFYERHGATKIGDHRSSIPGRSIPIYELPVG